MSMDVFRGVLGGLAEAHQAHNQNLLTQEMARRKMLTDFWQKRSEDPNMRDEERDRATQMFLGIAQTPHDKKLAKQFDPPASEILSGGIAPQTGQSWMGGQTSRQVETAPMPIPGDLGPTGETGQFINQPATQQTPPPDITRVPMPQPPPGVTMPSRYTEGEQLARGTRAARAKMDIDVEQASRIAEAQRAAEEKHRAPAAPKPVAGTVPGSALALVPELNGMDSVGRPFDPDQQYHITRDPATGRVMQAYPASAVARAAEWMRDADSSSGYSRVYRNPAGKITSVEQNLVPPASQMGSETTTDTVRFVTQADGTIAAVPVRTTTARTPIGAGGGRGGVSGGAAQPPAVAPPKPPPGTGGAGGRGAGAGAPGDIVGARPLTELQKERLGSQTKAQMNTLTLVNRVMKNLGVLNSLVDTGKIGLAISPNTGALVISRLAKLTGQEAQFAADFQNLAEDINTLRGAFQATGFRGPEAFAALQGLRGQLAADPQVTRAVLVNTTRALTTQIANANQSLAYSGSPLQATDDVLQAYLTINGGDAAKTAAMMRAEGWE